MGSTSESGWTPAAETLVFVYGTLQRGESSHHYLVGARFVGQARTAPDFELVDLGEYPAMVLGGNTAVTGELYAVTARGLNHLDELEDHPEYFRRTDVQLADGRQVVSYILPDSQASPYPRIGSGSWRQRA